MGCSKIFKLSSGHFENSAIVADRPSTYSLLNSRTNETEYEQDAASSSITRKKQRQRPHD